MKNKYFTMAIAALIMASCNMHFRDPIIYRVVKSTHHRTGTIALKQSFNNQIANIN